VSPAPKETAMSISWSSNSVYPQFASLLAYAASHPQARQWLRAIPIILARKGVAHG
jgi:hypothetical protein